MLCTVLVIVLFSRLCLYNQPTITLSHIFFLLLYEEALNASRWDCTVCLRTVWHYLPSLLLFSQASYEKKKSCGWIVVLYVFTITPPTHFTQMVRVDSIKKLIATLHLSLSLFLFNTNECVEVCLTRSAHQNLATWWKARTFYWRCTDSFGVAS